jgi:hypothetical protein
MGSTTLDETDATDGTGGAKVISIQSVSGDIAVSASATYVEKDLIDDAVKVAQAGIVSNSSGSYRTGQSNYDCYIVPVEFGKRYKVSGYDWKDKGGTATGYNIALVKSDGNGGYTNLLASDIVGTLFADNNEQFTIGTNIYMQFNAQKYPDTFTFCVPAQDNLAAVINEVYLAINTRFASVDISEDISIKELILKDEFDATSEIRGLWLLDTDNYNFKPYQYGSVVIVRAEKGATYSYSGFSGVSNFTGKYLAIGLGVLNGSLVSNLKATDFLSGSTWMANDSFFAHTDNIVKSSAAASGQFTIPSSSDIAGDICIVFNTRLSGTDIANNITLTKNS